MNLKFNINYSDGTVKEHTMPVNPSSMKEEVSKNQMIARAWLNLCVNYVYVYLENDAVVNSIEFVGETE